MMRDNGCAVEHCDLWACYHTLCEVHLLGQLHLKYPPVWDISAPHERGGGGELSSP